MCRPRVVPPQLRDGLRGERRASLAVPGLGHLAPMPPPPGLTKADVANFIEIYGNEEGGQARFAVYVGKPGAKAWCR